MIGEGVCWGIGVCFWLRKIIGIFRAWCYVSRFQGGWFCYGLGRSVVVRFEPVAGLVRVRAADWVLFSGVLCVRANNHNREGHVSAALRLWLDATSLTLLRHAPHCGR